MSVSSIFLCIYNAIKTLKLQYKGVHRHHLIATEVNDTQRNGSEVLIYSLPHTAQARPPLGVTSLASVL